MVAAAAWLCQCVPCPALGKEKRSQLEVQKKKGLTLVFISHDLNIVRHICHRVAVMYEGEIVGEFDPKTVTVEELGLYMAGSKRKEGTGA